MEFCKLVQERRSQRAFIEYRIDKDKIMQIMRAGMCAPSGKNGQPWKFIVVQNDKKLLSKIAGCTIYKFVDGADCLICIFLDKRLSYHYLKDAQAIGACIQNMLLMSTDLGIGSCWIGEILNRTQDVKSLLSIDDTFDFMGLVALGYYKEESTKVDKKSFSECLLGYF